MNNQATNAVLLSGASGFIGTSLLRAFALDETPTIRLVRSRSELAGTIIWNPNDSSNIPDATRLEGLAAAIHLSGANVSAHRWTAAYKREIFESRVLTTRTLVDLLLRLKNPPRTFLCASAIGIYGDCGDRVVSESSPPGQGFLAETCRAWEAEAVRAADAGIRVVALRFGVVLSPEGGPLKELLPIFRSGFAGRLGSGRQWMSWITVDDLVRAIAHILQTESIHGPVNVVAPIPVTNAEFTRSLAVALRRPSALPVPRFALRLAFGDMADEALLSSIRAIPERLASSGFHFDYPELSAALGAIL